MKKIMALLLLMVMTTCLFAACGSGKPSESKSDNSKAESSVEDPTVVNLMDLYSIKDPEGVEYDQRVVLYMPCLESDERYPSGVRHTFAIMYGKENQGVYMYNVDLYDTAEHAKAAHEDNGKGEVDEIALINATDENFFIAMKEFIPDFKTYIDNMSASGMVEL